MDVKKVIIISVIAVLYAVFVFSLIDAVYPEPDYSEYCSYENSPRPKAITQNSAECPDIIIPPQEETVCYKQDGYIEYTYDNSGCPTTYSCNTCAQKYNQVNDVHRQYVFYISALFALLAIFFGMYYPTKKQTFNEWIGIGFMIGGAFALFFGTASSYSSLGRIIRPIVILLELILVLFISYKKTVISKNKKIKSS